MNKQEELKMINDKLTPLYKTQDTLQKKIHKLFDKKRKLENDIDIEYSLTIPTDFEKISDEQWKWILYANHNETETQFKFQQKLFKTFCRYGFQEQTKQAFFAIHDHKKIEDFLHEFKFLKKHLLPVTIEDRHHGTETGICIAVFGIEEDYNSIIYIHEDEKVVLYRTKYSPKKEFENFESFLIWYYTEIKKNEDE